MLFRSFVKSSNVHRHSPWLFNMEKKCSIAFFSSSNSGLPLEATEGIWKKFFLQSSCYRVSFATKSEILLRYLWTMHFHTRFRSLHVWSILPLNGIVPTLNESCLYFLLFFISFASSSSSPQNKQLLPQLKISPFLSAFSSGVAVEIQDGPASSMSRLHFLESMDLCRVYFFWKFSWMKTSSLSIFSSSFHLSSHLSTLNLRISSIPFEVSFIGFFSK